MGKRILAALAGLVAVFLALVAVTALVRETVPAYPASMGDAHEVTEKITGQHLVRQAAEAGNLIIYGSSELKTTDIVTHPANFFAGGRNGIQVDLVGRGSCQSLIHALSIAASGDSLTGKKVVLITAPQSYVSGGIAPDLFMANFSEQQFLSMLDDETIPDATKQYLSRRVRELIDAYNEDTGAGLQTYTAAGLMAEAWAEGRSTALLEPYAALSRWLLNTRDLAASGRAIRAWEAEPITAHEGAIDWVAEEAAALAQAMQMATNNEYGMQDSYYTTYIGRKLEQQAGKDAEVSYDQSPEYGDLECLLELCERKGLEVLFVHVPMHGSWNDYTGFAADRRAAYYENVRQIVAQYDVELLDLTGWEYEPYFLCDTMHLGWKGWLEVDRAIAAFCENGEV